MTEPTEHPGAPDELDEDGRPGPTATDDETEADMGMVGGTGATTREGTEQPYGTEGERGEADEG